MRHRNVLYILFGVLAFLFAAGTAQAQLFPFSPDDWYAHRGVATRQGANGNLGLAGRQTSRIWVWPPTADMPAEMVADNTTLPPPIPVPGQIAFEVAGIWTYPALTDRTPGSWPSFAPDLTPDKVQDYIHANPQLNTELQRIGVDVLSRLPNLGTDPQIPDIADPTISARTYKIIHDQLVADTTFARWTFGTSYPVGTFQGNRNVGGQPLQANQRYAVFIRFPNSGTLVGGTPRPNIDHTMVRVSWGASINDPATSRIFMVNTGVTGGSWMRIRTGPGDDRFFPYDGSNPIVVTQYSRTPDDPNDANQFGAPPLVVADAVRLMPESLRGDIHASSVTAKFPLNIPDGAARNRNRTYFGRDETTGPKYFATPPTAAELANYPIGNFLTIPFDPTRPPNPNAGVNYNPLIADPSTSVRSAVFYCLEDDLANQQYAKLIWRYVARTTPVQTTTVDDDAGPPGFTPGAGWNPVLNPADQPYNATYHSIQVTNLGPSVTWETGLPVGNPASTYSIFVWIPGGGGSGTNFARYAHYVVDGDLGPIDIYLDQRNTDPTKPRVGAWRRVASGVRFPSGVFAGNPVAALGRVRLLSDSTQDIAEDPSRFLAADAIQFVAESQTANSVVAAPLLTSVTWPDGSVKQVVYFATTSGHVYALDANGVGPASTLTTAYWVYPSISNPDAAGDKNMNGVFNGPEDDPNNNPDPNNNQPTQGIDADLQRTTVGGVFVYRRVNTVPDLGAWVSSPLYVNVRTGMAPMFTYRPLIVIGNQNGRLYAFDPIGRTTGGGSPFANTIAGTLGPDDPGVPGTTRRLMTWPSTARDKWLRKGGDTLGQDSFKQFTEDPAKGVFAASPTAPVTPGDDRFVADRVIAGAGDGHVYCVDIQTLDVRERISNSDTFNPANDGVPRWQYPVSTKQRDPILQPGALTDAFDRYVFSAGGRVYAIYNPGTQRNGVATLSWVYPFTSDPPGNPNPNPDPNIGDKPPEETSFTAPAIRGGLGINGGEPVAFVANRDGRIFAFDVFPPAANPVVLWVSPSIGTTRASVSFYNFLERQPGFTAGASGPVVMLPVDSGGLTGRSALDGRLTWAFFDSLIGGVPLADSTGNILAFPTSVAWRGGDTDVANQWFYSGDEGNQDTGEMNGQMRAYGTEDIGLVTPDEPFIEPGVTAQGVELRLVELWNAQRDDPANMTDPTLLYEKFGDPDPAVAKSPYVERLANNQKQNTQGQILVYEWGDTIYVAAWGYYFGPIFPTVTFTLSSGSTNRSVTVGATLDRAYVGPAHLMDDGMGGTQPGTPWVAKYAFPLGRGSQQDPQTPGRQYKVTAYAQIVGGPGGPSGRTFTLSSGQFDPPALVQPPIVPPLDPAILPSVPRTVAMAHPLALTTRSVPAGTPVGAAFPNIIGYTTNIPVDNRSGDLTEIIANANVVSQVTGASIQGIDLKDMRAPVGLTNHGSSGAYMGVTPAGQSVPALFAADRSNLWKINQPLNNVRVERREMGWRWNPNSGSALQQATGNVMNPLPWETFPNTVPNVSRDYPDIDRTHASFKVDNIDMALRAATLDRPAITPGMGGAPSTKTLTPTAIDLLVDVPQFQPANVNRDYLDINGVVTQMLAPLVTTTGRDASTIGAIRNLIAPSAGYVGTYLVFIDSNGDGRYQGQAARTASNVQQVTPTALEEVFRQMNVGVAVPPDINIRTEETTLDHGNVPHGMGYAPNSLPNGPYAPSYTGPYTDAISTRWDAPGQTFFLPFTVRNRGNVNLVNVRVAKVIGDYATNVNNPAFWIRMASDQVDPLTNASIFGVRYNFLGALAVGNIGIVSGLDHRNTGAVPTWDWDFFPFGIPNVAAVPDDYVPAVNPLIADGWNFKTRPRPTLHKPLPGDNDGTILSIPDVAHGDRLNLLQTLRNWDIASGRPARETRPKVGVAIPLTTPAGTYTVPLYVYEDKIPEQWREWIYIYRGAGGGTPGDDDGIYNVTTPVSAPDSSFIAEARSDPALTLKVTVREARLTNGATAGSYPQIDLRVPTALRPNNEAFGANLVPFGFRVRDPNDLGNGNGGTDNSNVFVYWASNRPDNGGPFPTTSDAPWYLNYSKLNTRMGAVSGVPFFDWMYEPMSGSTVSWWNPLPAATRYPAPAVQNNLFPAQASDLAAGVFAPLVPGTLIPETIRHSYPAIAQDDDPAKTNAPAYAFWQGLGYKTASAGGQGFALDTRTFWIRLQNGVPLPGALPFSFRNDPALPKFNPKPIILTDQNGATMGILFWYGGAQGRTRLYYNINTNDLEDPARWSRDTVLPTPGTLQWQSDPIPIHRRVFTTYFNPAGETLDAIDLVYTGVLSNRRQPETILTRYAIRNGRLDVMPLTQVDNETLARDAANQTWTARDLAWLYRDPQTREFLLPPDAMGHRLPLFQIYVYDSTGASRVNYPGGQPAPINGYNPVTDQFTAPTFDNATGRLFFNSALGGQVIIDPQGGTVTFSGIAPRGNDRVALTYIPQSMRVNVTRNDSGVVTPPAGWAADPGFAGRAHVAASGANTGPVSFIDRSLTPNRSIANPATPPKTLIIPGPMGSGPSTVTRLWTFFKKSDANVTATSAIYYKTMRLMVRLPRGVLLDNDRDPIPHISVTGNRGPVEVDWARGRLYFTEADEGNLVTVTFNYARNAMGAVQTVPATQYRVSWGDEISTAVTPGDQPTNESALPTDAAVNEGMISAFKDPFQDKVWVFWASTRSGTTDLYYVTISPNFYPQPILP